MKATRKRGEVITRMGDLHEGYDVLAIIAVSYIMTTQDIPFNTSLALLHWSKYILSLAIYIDLHAGILGEDRGPSRPIFII